AFFSKYLKTSAGEKAVKYLESRGIKEETVRNFQIGFSPDSKDALLKELISLKISKEEAVKAGLASPRDNGQPADLFRNRIMFPIKSFNGDTIAFGGRAMGDASPKYLNSPETLLFSKRNALYGLYQALPTLRKFKKVLIVEGYMDVITLHQYGINFAVSPLGTALTSGQCLTLKRYCEEAYLMFDPDQAGINAAIKASDHLIEAGIYPKICLIEGGKDPDEFVIDQGAEAFYEKLNRAEDPISFKINLIKKGAGEIGPKDKSRMAAFLGETLARQKDAIIKSEWIKKISQELSLPESILLNIKQKKEREEQFITKEKIDVPPLEDGFVHLLLKNPKLIAKAGELKPEHLSSQFAKTIFSEFLFKNGDISIGELTEKYPQYSAHIMALTVQELPSESNCVSDFSKTSSMILHNYRLNKWKEMKKRLSSLSREEMSEFNELSKIIKK
ncbi:MAG: DNA primase, partial [Elusimicrobia bacterium]|nr:DNA primase [Elusimicrobiota bacterium]